MAKLASLLLTWAGFGLLQAVAERQPLADRLVQVGRHARVPARVAAFIAMILAYLALVPDLGWTEASLLVVLELALVASAFVLLAPVAPRFTFGLALLAAPTAGLLLLMARWTA